MFRKTLLLLIISLIVNISNAQKSNKCNYTINSYSWSFNGANIGKQTNVTIHDPLVQTAVNQGDSLALKGGDVICMDASVPYQFTRFINIVGDSLNPVIITNVGGQVKIKNTTKSYGWKFQKSSNFKILGNGDPNHKYGFKVTSHYNSFLQLIDRTSDFEIAHVEIAGDTIAQAQEDLDAVANSRTPKNLLGFAGIMAKSQPVCVDDVPGKLTDRGNFEMKNVFMHDNYIHNVSGEGMYVGYGYARQNILLNSWRNSYRDANDNYVAVKCTETNVPHDISNLHIFNNRVEYVGWDGIQVKNAYEKTSIYNNVIKNYATLGIGPHDEGLFVGDGSVAEIYGNWIENGTSKSNGIQINATGNTKVYNNVVLGAGYNGLYLNNNNTLDLPGVIEIYNNTLEGGSGNAITSYSLNQVVKIKNNLGFGFGKKDTLNDPWPTLGVHAHSHHIVSSNLTDKDPVNLGFVDFSNADIRLTGSSLAIDSGVNHDKDQYDFSGSPRIGNVDIGAFEFGSVLNSTDFNVAITTPSASSKTVSAGENVHIEVSLTDINNKVKYVQYILNDIIIGADSIPRKTEHDIDFQNLSQGDNIFKVKATLNGGAIFYSAPLTIHNNSALSVTSAEQIASQLKYYYNAVNKELVINNANNIDVKAIEIYNLLGKKIQSWQNNSNNTQRIRVRVNGLSTAVYIIKIKTSKSVLSKKLLLN